MRRKADWLFVLLSDLVHQIDEGRDRKVRWVVRSRIYTALRKRGLTANFLTDIRACIAVGLNWFLADNVLQGYNPIFGPVTTAVVLGLLLVAFATDAFDGATAREEEAAGVIRSQDGAHWDPFVDKILTLPILAYYWFSYTWWPRTLIATIIFGDAAATMIRRYSAKRKYLMPSNKFGRAKMALLCIGITLTVLLGPAGDNVVSSFLAASLLCGMISVGLHARSLARKVQAQGEAERMLQGAQK